MTALAGMHCILFVNWLSTIRLSLLQCPFIFVKSCTDVGEKGWSVTDLVV